MGLKDKAYNLNSKSDMEHKVQDAAELLNQLGLDQGRGEFMDIIDGEGLDEEEDFEFAAEGQSKEDNDFD